MTIYYKILNDAKLHNGFQYQMGHNELTEPFNVDIPGIPKKSGLVELTGYVKSGLYITNLENIHKYTICGTWIYEVTLPTDDPTFQMIEDGDQYIVNKLILGECYYLYDPDTIRRFPSIKYQNFLLKLCGLNDIFTFCKWLLCKDLEILYDECCMSFASSLGHTHFLQCWKQSGLELKYKAFCIDNTKFIKTLDWWKGSGLPLKYTELAMDKASIRGDVELLEWWRTSGLELKYTQASMDQTTYPKVLQWWVNSGLPLKYTEASLDKIISNRYNYFYSCKNQPHTEKQFVWCEIKYEDFIKNLSPYIEVLNWWLNSGLILKYTELAIDEASNSGELDILEWWKQSGLQLKYTESAIDGASRRSNPDVLEWWKESGLKLKYTENSLDNVNYVEVLDWWRGSNLELKYTSISMDKAIERGDVKLLEWWKRSGLEIKYSQISADKSDDLQVLDWLEHSGLPLPFK